MGKRRGIGISYIHIYIRHIYPLPTVVSLRDLGFLLSIINCPRSRSPCQAAVQNMIFLIAMSSTRYMVEKKEKKKKKINKKINKL